MSYLYIKTHTASPVSPHTHAEGGTVLRAAVMSTVFVFTTVTLVVVFVFTTVVKPGVVFITADRIEGFLRPLYGGVNDAVSCRAKFTVHIIRQSDKCASECRFVRCNRNVARWP